MRAGSAEAPSTATERGATIDSNPPDRSCPMQNIVAAIAGPLHQRLGLRVTSNDGNESRAARRASAEDEAFLHALGTRLRVLRAQRGMSRPILARRSGVSERYIAQMEAGRGNGSILLLRALAVALGVPAATLLEAP